MAAMRGAVSDRMLSWDGAAAPSSAGGRLMLEGAYRVTMPSQLRWQPRIGVVDTRGQEANGQNRNGLEQTKGGRGRGRGLVAHLFVSGSRRRSTVGAPAGFGSCIKRIDADEAGGRCFFVSEPELRHCLSPAFPLPSQVRHCFVSRLSSRAPEPRPGLSG